MKVKPQAQTDPSLNQMEAFLTPSSNPPKIDQKANPGLNKAEMEALVPNKQAKVPVQVPNKQTAKATIEEIEEKIKKIEEIERELKIKATLDLTSFNNLIYKKHLQFKVLFIRAKIYAVVRDNTSGKMATLSILPPRWGGSSLRYMLTDCVNEFCVVVERNTKKGTILTYQQLGKTNSQEDTDIDDIFE